MIESKVLIEYKLNFIFWFLWIIPMGFMFTMHKYYNLQFSIIFTIFFFIISAIYVINEVGYKIVFYENYLIRSSPCKIIPIPFFQDIYIEYNEIKKIKIRKDLFKIVSKKRNIIVYENSTNFEKAFMHIFSKIPEENLSLTLKSIKKKYISEYERLNEQFFDKSLKKKKKTLMIKTIFLGLPLMFLFTSSMIYHLCEIFY